MILEISLFKKVNNLLEERDKFRSRIILVRQALLGVLDLFRVFSKGLLGVLIISGVQSRYRGSRALKVLKLLPLENFSFQTESGCLGKIAVFRLHNERARFPASKRGIMEIISGRTMKNWAN